MNTRSILGNTRLPDISFHSSGKIDITSRIVKALGMEAGDIIDIMVDKSEYYLYVSAHASEVCGRHEAQCYPSKRNALHFRTYSRRLTSAILRLAGISTRASFPAGEVIEVEGRKAIPIITRNNLRHD